MKFARTIRYSIIKAVRFWKPKLDFSRERVNAFLEFSIFDAIENAKKSRQKNKTPSQEHNRTPATTRGSGIQSLTHANPSDGNQNRTTKKRRCTPKCIKEYIEIIGILGGLVGIGGGIVGLVFLWKQYGQMVIATNATKDAVSTAQGQLQAMTNQTSVMQGQWQAMTNQSVIMRGQLDEMKHAAELDERAWVGPYSTEVKTNEIGKYFSIKFRNLGKTPALKCTTWLDNSNLPDGTVFTSNATNECFTTIFPNGDHTLDTGAQALNAGFIECLRTNGIHEYVYGVVKYDDIFGIHHWTTFCWDMNDLNSFNGTLAGNSCDDNDKTRQNLNFIPAYVNFKQPGEKAIPRLPEKAN
ncbi:MAG: hypothetical protein ABSE48_19490 [Verrucomicrobiota bacterium]